MRPASSLALGVVATIHCTVRLDAQINGCNVRVTKQSISPFEAPTARRFESHFPGHPCRRSSDTRAVRRHIPRPEPLLTLV